MGQVIIVRLKRTLPHELGEETAQAVGACPTAMRTWRLHHVNRRSVSARCTPVLGCRQMDDPSTQPRAHWPARLLKTERACLKKQGRDLAEADLPSSSGFYTHKVSRHISTSQTEWWSRRRVLNTANAVCIIQDTSVTSRSSTHNSTASPKKKHGLWAIRAVRYKVTRQPTTGPSCLVTARMPWMT